MLYSSSDAADYEGERCVKIVAASDSSLLVVFGDAISPDMRAKVLGLFHGLKAHHDGRIRNLHPGYASLLVDFDPLAMTHDEAAGLVESLAGEHLAEDEEDGRLVEIPICYGGDFGPDLQDVSTHADLPLEDVVRLHSDGGYRVSFLGFTAGFAYLSGMPDALSMPRLSTPRRIVAAGSVGIAGGQTGIYPTETPGGWRLIGRTPLRMFNPVANQPTLVMPGDHVRFVSIDRGEFERLKQERR